MCFLCLRDNPFDMIDVFVPKDGDPATRARAKARAIKVMLNVIDEDLRTQEVCHIGDVTIERLKEEQQKVSRDL